MNHLNKNDGYKHITNNQEHQHFPEGKPVVKLILPSNIPQDIFPKFLYNLGLTYIFLNPTHIEEMIRSYIDSINLTTRINKRPLSGRIINQIAKNVWKEKLKQGDDLYIKPNGIRYTCFCEDIQLTGSQMKAKSNEYRAQIIKNKTCIIINEAIEDWNSSDKITQKSIAIKTGLSIDKIKRNWKEFKSIVKNINNESNKQINEMSQDIINENNIQSELSIAEKSLAFISEIESIEENNEEDTLVITLSKITFRLGNGCIVYIPSNHVDNWNKTLTQKGSMRLLRECFDQYSFNYQLNK